MGRLVALITDTSSYPQDSNKSRVDFEKYIYMLVTGSKCVVFDDTGKTSTVNSFTKSARSLDDLKIDDVAVACNYSLRTKIYIMLTRNALHIPEVSINLYHHSLRERVV